MIIRAICIGLIFGGVIGAFLSIHASDYADSYWFGAIYYKFHKQRHNSSLWIDYDLDSSMGDLSEHFTLGQAESTIDSAAEQWNDASGKGHFNFKNVQGSGNELVEYYNESEGLAYATWEAEQINGKWYVKPTGLKIEYNSKYDYKLNGDAYHYSLTFVTLHEMGHWLDFKDQTPYSSRFRIMYQWRTEVSDKNNLHQDDKDTIEKIYDDLVWDYFGLLDSYNDGGSDIVIRGRSWEPAFYTESSSGPTNPPDMEDGEERKFIMKVSGERGAYDYNLTNSMDSTMRLIWDDDCLDRVGEGYWVESPHTTTDTWWFATNPYWGDDTGWLCVNFNSGSFSNSDLKHAEMYIELQAYDSVTDTSVTARVTTADYHALPWETRDDTIFRFDIT